VRDPSQIALLGETQFAHGACGVQLVRRDGGSTLYAYVVTMDRYRTGGSGLYVVDVTDPARPTIRAFEPARGAAMGVVVHGDQVVVSVWDARDRFRWPWITLKPSGHAMVFDARSLGNPRFEQDLPWGSFTIGPHAMASIDGVLWVATAEGGLMAWR
jgi:hypothetical protein